MYAYDDNFKFARAHLSKLIVIFCCGISLSHSANGKLGSQDAKPDLKWFL